MEGHSCNPSYSGGRGRRISSVKTVWVKSMRTMSKTKYKARSWWVTPVILATQEAEIRRTSVQSQPRQMVPEILSRKKPSQERAGTVAQGVGPEFKPRYHKKEKKEGAGRKGEGIDQMMENLPSIRETLGIIPGQKKENQKQIKKQTNKNPKDVR
jgi:hypothetical protein